MTVQGDQEDAPQPVVAPPGGGAILLRLILSVVVVCLAWSLVDGLRVMLTRPYPEAYAGEALQREEEGAQQAAVRRSVHFPWPRYPGAQETGRSQIALNGVPVVEQTLTARATPEKILAFYRKTMLARGWRNNTEEFYRVTPAALRSQGVPRNLQDENYLRRYDSVKRSKLSLVRRKESILVEVRPGERRSSVVELHYLGTSSLFSLADDMIEAARKPRSDTAPLLQSSSAPGQPNAGTKIYYSKHRPNSFFHRMVNTLERQGWTRSELPLSGREQADGPRLEALFLRDDWVASLVVTDASKKGSTAMVTQTRR